jgi:hypothetical protein
MIALDLLLQSASGELDENADLEVEEHVLSCGRCAAIYASLLRMGPAIAALVSAGKTQLHPTASLVSRLEREGLVSRRYELSPGRIVPCGVGAEDIYALLTLWADLSSETRVDFVRVDVRTPDVPFDKKAGRVYVLAPSEVLRTFPTMKVPLRLVGVARSGEERIIADYTLDHTAFAP